MNLGDFITVIFVTVAREQAAQRLVKSVRDRYPEIPIIAADQGGPTDRGNEFYREHNVQVIWLPPDCGLSFARNRAMEQIRTPYALIADDDFIFTEETDLVIPLEIMQNARRLGFLGGRIIDIRQSGSGEEQRFLRRWEKFLFPAQDLETLISVPIDYLPLQTLEVGEHPVFLCDMPLNWGLLRRAAFSEELRWDERIKINGEHEDFFLNMKFNSSWKAAFFPGLVCDHESSRNREYQALRSRQAGRQILAQKWGFKHHLEIGTGLRNYDDYLSFEQVPVTHPLLAEVPGQPGLQPAPGPASKSRPPVRDEASHQSAKKLVEEAKGRVKDIRRRRELLTSRINQRQDDKKALMSQRNSSRDT